MKKTFTILSMAALMVSAGCAKKPATAEAATTQTAQVQNTQATTNSVVKTVPTSVKGADVLQTIAANYKGKVVLFDFWATWCPPCREELTRVQAELIDRFEGRDFVFLPISRGETRETVARFREQTGYRFPMGLDPEQTIYKMYATNFIPRNFLVGPDGRVIVATTGYEPEEFDALVETIRKSLDKQQYTHHIWIPKAL